MKTRKSELSILVIEDNLGDFALVEEFLIEEIDDLRLIRAKNCREAVCILANQDNHFDVILLDLSLPDKTGAPLIKEITALCINKPVIVLTGYTDFDFGVQSLSLGISDYLLKEELTSMSLYKSILYSLERKKALAELKESEKKYSELFHLSPQPMYVFDLESLQFLNVNNAAIKHYGYTREEFLSMTIRDITPFAEIEKMEASLADSGGGLIYQGNFTHKKRNGELIRIDTQSNIMDYKGREAVVILAIDVTERLSYISAIEAQNENLREISWIQSHVVRAPLARIMGLIQILKNSEGDEKEMAMEYILLSANELDDTIKDITNKTLLMEQATHSKCDWL